MIVGEKEMHRTKVFHVDNNWRPNRPKPAPLCWFWNDGCLAGVIVAYFLRGKVNGIVEMRCLATIVMRSSAHFYIRKPSLFI
jgi:hypothetical protein